MEGRWITENLVVAQEVIHKIKKHKRGSGLMMLKVDLKKAYDSLEWVFVITALKYWKFSEEVQQIIKSCLGTVQFSILLNGGVIGNF